MAPDPAADALRSLLRDLPAGLQALVADLHASGGRALLVGGGVRDGLLGRGLEDYDLEVFGLPLPALEAVLARHGAVHAVGEAFTVLKLAGVAGIDGAVDVALPRRDSKTGPGHRGFAVTGDPAMTPAEAARRRDFTINAMSLDPRTGELIDPTGGRADVAAGVLRAVDAATFGDDPLRALRAVQLAARYEFTVEPATAALCRAMPLAELPAERVWGEIEKLLLLAERPSIGLALLDGWGLLPAVAPELLPLRDTPQEPEWHPEGDVWVHTLQVIDQAAALRDGLDKPRALALMLGALCHDLGKPATTRFFDGRTRSPGHEEAGVPPTLSLLERWKVWTLAGYDVRAQVVALVAHHLKPGQLYKERDKVGDGAIRRLAKKCEADLLERVARADCLGRAPGVFAPLAMDWFRDKVRALDVVRGAPPPLLLGRHALELGLAPGPAIGRLLQAVYERQLDGEVTGLDEALALARRLLASASDGREAGS
ncbi:MAG: HD domain-containing protein [Vicinamibacteria bacterium]|nr:HD domain-containing protein [Vicinamibacteria bacterium]